MALVNGQPVDFIVDTGATTIALTIEDARRIGLGVDPSTSLKSHGSRRPPCAVRK
jgi:predicted aspartyl protease